ncbi:MAG TPA: hypothetical protein VGG68_00095 [Caulobacteraceae bacterium]
MQLVYSSPEQTTITVTLDDGEHLGNLNGSVTAFVPTDPANTDYAAILEQNLTPEPYVPPPAVKE